jgi:hypothetical protein
MSGDLYDIERRKRLPPPLNPSDPGFNAGLLNGIPILGTPPGDDYDLIYTGGMWQYHRSGESILLARLGAGGVFLGSSWFPNEFAGLFTAGTTSAAAFESAAGYCCESASEEIGHLVAQMAFPSATAGTVEMWAKTGLAVACPAGFTTPGVPSPTGIIITFGVGDTFWENSNPTDKITIAKGDTLAFAMNPGFGFSPGSLSLFAHRIDRS